MGAVRVAYIGNFEPPHSTENHYAISFEALSCQVTRFQENRTSEADVRAALDQTDLLLYTRTWNSLDKATARIIAEPPDGVVTAAVHLDVWWDLDREDEPATSAMFRAQHVFTADGRYPDRWAALGVNHHYLMPAVVDLDLVGERLGTPDPDRWPFDVAFIGSKHYHHEWPFRPALIDYLAARYGKRFAHVGGDGAVRGTDGGAMRGQELNDLYATVPVIVGDSCFAAPDIPYVSDRAFETPGRGGFSVFPAINEVQSELWSVPSQVYYQPGNLDSVGMVVDLWLERFADNPKLHEGLTAQGARWIKGHATYTKRAATILTVGFA